MKLIMLKGLPASGKSTYARGVQTNSPDRVLVINNDLLREALHGNLVFERKREDYISHVRNILIVDALKLGQDVIIDNLNLSSKHEPHYRQLAALHGATFEVVDHFLKVPVWECVERDKLRPKPVGSRVIHRWWRDYVQPTERKRWTEKSEKPFAIIVDLDGTLAEGIGAGRRGAFEQTRVYEDDVVRPVQTIVRDWWSDGEGTVIFLSGREESCRAETERWLLDKAGFDVRFESIHLYMRETGDSRDDTIAKRELFEKYVEPFYHVEFVIDDRQKVCNMWQTLGLYVLRVGCNVDF